MEKKLIGIFIYLIAFFACKAYAQSTVSLDITLYDVVAVSMPANSPSSNFNSQAAYASGITTTTVDDHLDLLSLRNYKISVQEGAATTSAPFIAAAVTMKKGGGVSNGNYTGVSSYPAVTLSSASSSLVVSTNRSFDAAQTKEKYNIVYVIAADKGHAGKYSHTEEAIPVTYTITQP